MSVEEDETVLEGVFAVAKPVSVSSADVLVKLQATFAPSSLFAPLLRSQPERPSKSHENVFKMGHGGTLDPLAEGVLIVGIGRGTKHLNQYLASTKTYETVVGFGESTDTYDCTGQVVNTASYGHVTRDLVERVLEQFRGNISQLPPVYSALKINGVKSCEYARKGQDLPRPLESREMRVDECVLLEWISDAGDTRDRQPPPSARIRLTVSSGFYVRSFAHDLGIACQSLSHMTALHRTRQGSWTTNNSTDAVNVFHALTYEDLDAGEQVWGAKLKPQLEAWVNAHPKVNGHINGREAGNKRKAEEKQKSMPKQRFRGDWVAETKQERIKQQGGKYKGKWGPKKREGAVLDPPTSKVPLDES